MTVYYPFYPWYSGPLSTGSSRRTRDKSVKVFLPPLAKSLAIAVSKEYEIPVYEIVGHGRTAKVCAARQDLMYRLHSSGQYSLPKIGKMLGGRDHSTVHHNIQVFKVGCGKISPPQP